jgi:hypothetical protein
LIGESEVDNYILPASLCCLDFQFEGGIASGDDPFFRIKGPLAASAAVEARFLARAESSRREIPVKSTLT